MRKRCKTCKHWTGEVPYHDDFPEHGQCEAIFNMPEYPEDFEIGRTKLAFSTTTWDYYGASVYTKAEFGCVLWEKMEE